MLDNAFVINSDAPRTPNAFRGAASAGAVGVAGRPNQDSTVAAYAKDVRLYAQGGGTIPCDAHALLQYVRKMRLKVAPSTLHRRLMAVRAAHLDRGVPSPTDDPTIRALIRSLQLGCVPCAQSTISSAGVTKRSGPKASLPITRRLLGQMLDYVHRSMRDRRDRALLTLGFVAALKRNELVAIDVGDLDFTPDAMMVRLKARRVAVPVTGGELCAATAVRTWIEHAALDPGNVLFCRFDRGGDPTTDRLDSAWVSVVVKQRLKAAGIDPKRYSAQSLITGRRSEAAKGTL
jgi:integrase